MSKLDQLRALREASSKKPEAAPKPSINPAHAAYLDHHRGRTVAWLLERLSEGFRIVEVGGAPYLTGAPDGPHGSAPKPFDKRAYQREYMRKRRATLKAAK